MKIRQILGAVLLLVAISFGLNSCGPKDNDVKASVEEKLKASPATSMLAVDVKDGVATLSGEVKDENSKADAERMTSDTKGVKSVVNNVTVAAPPPLPVVVPDSVNTTLDDATQQKVKDGLKDIPGVTVEFTGDKAVLSGQVTKANRIKIMQMLAAAKVQSDVSNLRDKK